MAFYIQADEVLHEDDGRNLWKWIDRAEKENANGVIFQYNHFARDPWHVKKTYKDGFDFYDKEIRLFKNDNSLISFGDGQSFCFVEDYLHNIVLVLNNRVCRGGHIKRSGSASSVIHHCKSKSAVTREDMKTHTCVRGCR